MASRIIIEKRLAFREAALEKLYDAYTALVDGGVKSYMIDDRQLTRFDLPALSEEITQTLEDARFLDAEYAYIVTPTADSLTAWGDAGIRVGDVTENGKMPFTCTDTPASAITVNIYRAEVAQ